MQLIVLHRTDGGEVAINPKAITSLHMSAGPRNKVVAPDAHCAIGLSDGKFVFVREDCVAVRQMLDERTK